MDDLLNTAKQIEEEHERERQLKLEEDRKEQFRRKRDKIEVRMDELEEVLQSDVIYLRMVENSSYRGQSIGAYRIEISDSEDFDPASLLFDSRDLASKVNKEGIELLTETFARGYTFQGFEVFIDGKPYKPHML